MSANRKPRSLLFLKQLHFLKQLQIEQQLLFLAQLLFLTQLLYLKQPLFMKTGADASRLRACRFRLTRDRLPRCPPIYCR